MRSAGLGSSFFFEGYVNVTHSKVAVCKNNVDLWNKVRHFDENAARQIARQIVDFARQHKA